jgi:hypothetical protein
MNHNQDAQILGKIQALQAQKKRLYDIFALAPFKNPTFFFYGKEGTFVSLDQSMINFNLSYEIVLLLEAAVNDLEFQINEQLILLK